MTRETFGAGFMERQRFVLQQHDRANAARLAFHEAKVIVDCASKVGRATRYQEEQYAKAQTALVVAENGEDAAISEFADFVYDEITKGPFGLLSVERVRKLEQLPAHSPHDGNPLASATSTSDSGVGETGSDGGFLFVGEEGCALARDIMRAVKANDFPAHSPEPRETGTSVGSHEQWEVRVGGREPSTGTMNV